MRVGRDNIEVQLRPGEFGIEAQENWTWSIPLPARKPFREAKLRIDAEREGRQPDPTLLQLLAEAFEVRQLVLGNPTLSLNQLASREGRCRKQLGKLLRLSWLSPRMVEAIADGTQRRSLTRSRLLGADLPTDWLEQEQMLGFTG